MGSNPDTSSTPGRTSDDANLLRVASVTVRDFRGLTECTLALEPGLTLLVGRNGSGKSRLLRALALACGSVAADGDEFTVGISASPTIDLVLAPPPGQDSFDDRVAALFGNRVQLVSTDGAQRIAWRTTISRSAEGWGGRSESRFLTYDVATQAWVLPSNATPLDRSQRGAIFADLVSTGRDIAAELSRPGSAIRRILSDLDVPDAERDELQDDLQALSARIVESSAALAAVHKRLSELEQAVAGIGQPRMSPLPARLEELARTVEIALENTGAGPLPMRLHGSGARSLASLQVQSVLYDRHLGRDGSDLPTHPLTLVEEPEAHLHPQACFDLVALLERMSGQVVVSTHSSHLVTVAPTEALRLVRQEGDGTVLRSLHPIDGEPTTPGALRVGFAAVEWEKLKRLVERPFGELLFASAVVVGDGASERGFLPHLMSHVLGHAAAGVCVVDPGSMSQAHPVVKFAQVAGIPCVLFNDADRAGTTAEQELPSSAKRVWVTGDPVQPGALEAVLVQHDEQWCLDRCQELLPSGQGTARERLDVLKGSYGAPLGRAFVRDYPAVTTWPKGFQDLVDALAPAVDSGADDG